MNLTDSGAIFRRDIGLYICWVLLTALVWDPSHSGLAILLTVAPESLHMALTPFSGSFVKIGHLLLLRV